ncbi:MAG TPA: outer membrane lipoprotein carrier protein LolA [Candidatus Omnitrophica bacterium]|nr:outer membrane lipoprotein carrier protein LolA [Candidatus Omnitrophota bacterium]
MKILTAVVLGMVIILTPLCYSQSPLRIEQIQAEVRENLEKINSYYSQIEIMFFQAGGENMQITGEIFFAKPDKIKMTMGVKGSESTNQYMYSDGDTLWQYMPFFKLASKVDLKALKEEFPNAEELVKNQSQIDNILMNIGNPEFEGIEDLDGESVYVIKGDVPKNVESELELGESIEKTKIFISKKDGLHRKVEYYSSTNQLLYMQGLKSLKINIEIPDSTFEFQLPEGINVLDSTPQARELLLKSHPDS